MKKLLFCLVLLSVGCNLAPPPKRVSDGSAGSRTLPPSKPIGDMSWTMIDAVTNADGSENKMKDLKGKAVILDFWATYCPPCIEEIPHLKQLRAKYGKENLEIVGLHIGGEDDRPQVPEFAARLQIDYPLATPEDALTQFVFGSRDDIPQTAIFDREGNLVEKFVGFGEPMKKDLDAAVEKAVNGK